MGRILLHQRRREAVGFSEWVFPSTAVSIHSPQSGADRENNRRSVPVIDFLLRILDLVGSAAHRPTRRAYPGSAYRAARLPRCSLMNGFRLTLRSLTLNPCHQWTCVNGRAEGLPDAGLFRGQAWNEVDGPDTDSRIPLLSSFLFPPSAPRQVIKITLFVRKSRIHLQSSF